MPGLPLIALGSDNLLIRAMDAFELGVTPLFSFFGSDKDDADLLNLLPANLLPSVDLLALEPFCRSLDTSEVLILVLCNGDEDPGSESLNLDPLMVPGESFAGNFLVWAVGAGERAELEPPLDAILFCLSSFNASMRFWSASSCKILKFHLFKLYWEIYHEKTT